MSDADFNVLKRSIGKSMGKPNRKAKQESIERFMQRRNKRSKISEAYSEAEDDKHPQRLFDTLKKSDYSKKKWRL